jgi:uncharacterized protein Smg (DUF494 family)
MTYILRSFLLLATLLAVPAWGASPQDIREVQLALARVAAEQQSVYQQFQMVQALLRDEEAKMQPLQRYTPPTAPRNYEDVIREQNDHTVRIKQYQDELDRLYIRYRDLDLQRSQLAQTLSSMGPQRSEGR